MNQDREREEIAGWFRELQQREERGAPRFDAVVAAARSRGTRSVSRRLYYRIAAATALLVLLALPVLWWEKHRQAPAVPALQTASITQWTSPTSFLVETPGQTLLKTVPRLDDGFIEMKKFNPKEKR